MKVVVKNIIPVAIVLIVMSASCKKAAYLTDGGVSNAKSSLSTYDYLKGHQYHYFDTVILMIDHFGLKDSVNKAGTFFAFTDFAVNSLMKNLGVSSLDGLYAKVSSKLLTQYMFTDKLTLDKAGTVAVQVQNWAGSAAPAAYGKNQFAYTVYLTNSSPVFTYYTLTYVKINGVLDGSNNAPPSDPPDLVISCQTTGIQTSTGTTLHVLINNAPLNVL